MKCLLIDGKLLSRVLGAYLRTVFTWQRRRGRALGIDKGSPEPHKEKVAELSRDQLRQIAETKMPDLNANDVDSAMKVIAGTARSMGVTVAS